MNKASWIVALIIGVVIGAAGDRMLGPRSAPAPEPVAQRPSAPAPTPPPPSEVAKIPIRPDDPSRGPTAAKVTVVLFSDFQCPFCGRVEPTVKQLEEKYPKALRVVWKNQPLAMHANAMPAAIAAEAAREQGKFWEFHDLAFENQQALSPQNYEAWAARIGLDVGRFKKAIGSPATKARVEEDVKLASEVGVTGTPTLFLNCRKIVGAQPLANFEAVVDQEIKKADALIAKGVALDGGFYDKICDENVKSAPKAPVAAAQPPPPSGPVDVPLRPDDPIRGPKKAPVTIVVFSDFQCPFCGRAEGTIKQIEETYGKKVRVAWKNQPLPFHPNAMPAAIAAEAAREQGKFWEMHDKLFSNQSALSPAIYDQYAKEIGLNMSKFKAALSDPRTKARIEADQQLAAKVGVGGTPTFFVNGQRIVGAQPFEQFKQVIDAQLAKR